MKIAINTWLLRNKKIDGIGVVTIEAISRIIKLHTDVEFMILCDKGFTENYFDYPNVKKYKIFPALRHPVLYILYLEVILPIFLFKHKPDLFISMDGFLSLTSPVKQLSCIYDLNFHHFPNDITLKNRLYYNFFFPKFARKAKMISTLSEYSKQDIVNEYKINPQKIEVMFCGIKEIFKPIDEEIKNEVRNRYTNGNDYFFFVGSMNPRKNIPRLMAAFDHFKKQTNSKTKLVLAGYFVWQSEKILNEFEKLTYKDEIIFPGRVPDEELSLLLAASKCLTFVPLFEGFGLPLVEAWACDVPVIASNITSVPEIAGDAAIMVDPYAVPAIAEAMRKVENDENSIRAQLIKKGRERRNIFTWTRSANLFWQTIEKCMMN